MQLFLGVYLVLGFAVGLALYSWIFVSSVRRHGFRATIGGATRVFVRDLPLNWRVPWAAWTFVIGIPVVAAWATITGRFDLSGAVALAIVWLLYVALLRWHLRARKRTERD
jgi:hypothetical protein